MSANPFQLLSGLVAISALAGISPPHIAAADPAASTDQVQVRWSWDHAALLPALHATAPTGWWFDPRASATVQHITRQYETLHAIDRFAPPFVPLLREGRGLMVVAHAPREGDDGYAMPRWAGVIDAGAALPALTAYAARMPGAPLTIAGFAGRGTDQIMAGVADGRFGFGRPDTLAAMVGADAPERVSAAPIWLTCDFASTIRLMRLRERDGEDQGLDGCWPGWRDMRPALTAEIQPVDGVWSGRVRVTGAGGSPLRAIDPALLALARADQHLVVAAGLDAVRGAALIATLIGPAERDQLAHDLGVPLVEALGMLTGDVLIQGRSAGLIPSLTLAAPIKSGSDLARLMERIGDITPSGRAVLAGGGNALTINTPIGPFMLAANRERLVYGNDRAALEALLAGTPGGAALPAGKALVVRADLPVLAKQWLPVAIAALGAQRLPLTADATWQVAWSLPTAALALIHRDGADAPLSRLSDERAGALAIVRGTVSTPVETPPTYLRSLLAAVLPGGDAQAVDRCFALYADRRAAPIDRALVVYRLVDGWRLADSNGLIVSASITAADLAVRLAGLDRLVGPDPAQLVALTPPETPSIDRRWMGDATALLAQLRPYQLAVALDGDGLRVDESGFPLMTLGAIASAIATVIDWQPTMLRRHRQAMEDKAQDAQRPPGDPRRRPGVVDL